ncbi:MAG: dTDP-4-amino-4,6-dideoxygalactose transaminase [Selenomonadaceae bacterium]|nr:dTDP-4-amino-4,6-dideoxygalactose transaminase [Selenomonadaceae bacterium]
MIPFNVPIHVGEELKYIEQAINNRKISGDGEFTRKCSRWIEKRFGAQKVLLTTSGTSALDMAMMLCGLRAGDEVILPSFTFSSTATSIILGGGVPVFVDIRPDTMNIDESKIEAAITDRTRAIMVVHYAGVSCAMDEIMSIAARHGLKVVEDAAQAFMSMYRDRACGTIGDFGCYSFHETKNYSMGEGGALLIRDREYNERAEVLREKGTNRSKFYRGEIDKYTWIEFGDSYLPSELNAAYLWAQLERADEVNDDRLRSWRRYHDGLKALTDRIEIPSVPEDCRHNAHMFWIKLRDLEERTAFIDHMRALGIGCVFHYVPLHSAPAGLKYGRFDGVDEYTTRDSDRLVRLPMWYGLSDDDVDRVVEAVKKFLGVTL